MDLENIHWQLPAIAPAWLAASVRHDCDPWNGAYSAVYPLDSSQVVKLVAETGALGYLRLCQAAKNIPHLPVVHEILPTPVIDVHTGNEYWAVRMERLRSAGTAVEPYANAFRRCVQARMECTDSNVALSYLAVTDLAHELRPCHRSLASCLEMLAVEMVAHDWVADLANFDNWMFRADGTLVLSDAAHHVRNFADDLI